MDADTVSTYKRFRPAAYKPKMAMTWWLKKPTYLLYILRELTAVFVASYAVILLLTVRALSAGTESWAAWIATLQRPGMIAFHVLALAFAVYHSITWFTLAPTALVVKVKDKVLPANILVAVHVVVWLACSGFIAFVLLRA